ncbi:hypothetical protein [Legionella tucsonensis]|uniref:Secreted protein n=1 Tax=Legionella tucsonensis TaxID=40335 RepID=A0A0W0ZVD8_9GAMM|nr:hypothetical protein [Legionella tucsonensis]KTD73090.1 secreted protein [Legionella tucsonensis]
MKKTLLTALLLTVATAALADSMIVTETQTWKSVPITVDTTAHTYTTVEGPVPTGDFYYTYPGYRCLKEKREIAGVDALIFHASIDGGSVIYCYPE